MGIPEMPCANCALQARVETALERYVRPCFTAGYEHLAASANDQGEVWLSGLVTNPAIAEEATRIVKTLPDVRFVFNYITVMYTPQTPRPDVNLSRYRA